MKVLALDPGDIQSGFCVLDSDTLRPIRVGKELNATCLLMVQVERYDFLVIERVASYGMPVGREVLEPASGWAGIPRLPLHPWGISTGKRLFCTSATAPVATTPPSDGH